MAGAFSASSLFDQLHAAEIASANSMVGHLSPARVATDEDYWSLIRQAYTVSPNLINLNNGGVSPAPRVVQEAVERYNKLTNEGPSYFMWEILDQGREPLREKLAELGGCSKEEIVINRNATESLNTVILGLDLKAGDEVIGCKLDYPNHMNAWKQRALRDGIVYKQLSFNFPVEDDDQIVAAFENAITSKTKIIHVTHVINWVGQILPVRKISDMAHRHGLEVVCDGAHSFALLDFKIPDLGCDYFATSLHKFLSAPIGSGMLWIRQDKISKIWPLLANGDPRGTNIRKFETLGTRSFPIEQGIGEAINFQMAIGNKRKEERVRYLKNYWAEQVINIPKVKIRTSLKAAYSCAICGVSIDGISPAKLERALFNQYKIHTVPIEYENVSCVRVTPHVYTSLQELDKLVRAIREIATAGK
ncbi:Isopenicillin N epimerase [Dyadobacter sp. CECT 9275]|uniref:Isopenicillin N epimerase n=2 Tax=Dyadobacter helix TaxID=2822344 RepID=A0A916JBR4_9BACT|nr:Isopenicillin N epimerase [Dyadobacter sp. CECT 9275]